jgi:septal ring factor EnvC (AmiA/AmiB activator)
VQATKLKHQLTYEQRRDLKADVAAAKSEVKKIQENLEKLEDEARKAAEATKEVEQELAAEVPGIHPSSKDTALRRFLAVLIVDKNIFYNARHEDMGRWLYCFKCIVF